MPIMTIGIPVYNAMPLLPETINSILNQDFHDFELLIVDDGCTDGSTEYLETLKDSRIRILRQENRGITFTRNRLLREARTPWLVSSDNDDISYPSRIKVIAEYIKKYPNAGMFYSLARYHGSFGTFRTSVASPAVLRNLTKAGYLLAICQSTCTFNIQKTLDVGGYRFNMHVDGVEDVDLFWRLVLLSDIVLIPEFTAAFRLSFSSVSSKSLQLQSLNALYVQYLLLSHLWNLNPLPYDTIKHHLATMLDKRKIHFRENIRNSSIYAAKGNYIKASISAAKSLAMPDLLLKRATYDRRQNEVAVNGIDPSMFATFSDKLWVDLS